VVKFFRGVDVICPADAVKIIISKITWSQTLPISAAMKPPMNAVQATAFGLSLQICPETFLQTAPTTFTVAAAAAPAAESGG